MSKIKTFHHDKIEHDMRKSQSGFTEEEYSVMENLVKAHNLYVKLEKQHPSDILEWVNAIHTLQQIMGMRILRREHPEVFYKK